GSTLAFLFLHPVAQLELRQPEQRMLQLALRQHTDEEIAVLLGWSRAYVRKLWGQIYAELESRSVLPPMPARALARRGPAKARLALKFFLEHPQELRPGILSTAG